MNLATLKATFGSYIAAIERLNKRGFKELNRTGSGYTHYLGENFSCYNSKIEEADSCSIHIENLMEYGKPILINKDYSIYRDSFFMITFFSYETYYSTYMGWGCVSEDGESVKESVKKTDNRITVEFGSTNIGLGYWNEAKKKALRKMAAKCKPNVSKKIIEAISEADKNINEWKAAKQKYLKAS